MIALFRALSKLVKFISYPLINRRCICCDSKLRKANRLCPKCWQLIDFRFETKSINNISYHFICNYNNFSKLLIKKFKYENRQSIAEIMANLIIHSLKEYAIEFDIIIPTPIHRRKLASRGFNQTSLIAKKIAKKTKKTLLRNYIKKIKYTKSQTSLTAKQRQRNLANSFKIHPTRNSIKNKNILIIDDVYTTGTTMKTMSKELSKGLPKKINVICFAKRDLNF